MANLIKLSDKFESVMYIALLAITAAIRGTYQELGLEFLKNRRWLRRVSYLYRIIFTKSLPYLYELIPPIHIVLVSLVVLKLYVAGLDFSTTRFYRLMLNNGIN